MEPGADGDLNPRIVSAPGLLSQLSWADLQKLRTVVMTIYFDGLLLKPRLREKLKNNPRVMKQIDQFIEQVLPTVMEERLAAQIESSGFKRSIG